MKNTNLLPPLVSIYIVNHNYGEFLETAIHSVLNQTLTNYEIIFIDNGSTDLSRKKLEGFYSHPKIRIILQKNIGLNAANNVALKLAKGKYIIRLDADDYFDKNALEILSSKLERDDKLGMVFSDYYTVDKFGNIIEMFRRHDFSEVELLDQPAHGACSMVRKEFLRAINGYDASYHCQDGWDLWVRFIKKFSVGNINLPLFFYRQHGKNLTKKKKKILTTRANILSKNAKNIKAYKKKCVAVIPIRGSENNSESVALKKLGKKKVIDWTIDEILKSKKISKIIISTPDKKIIKYVNKKYKNIITYSRDFKLARFGVTLDKALTNLFHNIRLDAKFEKIFVLLIEYPFRSWKYIDMASNTMDIFKIDRVISVKQEDKKFYRHSGKSLVPIDSQFFLKLEKNQIFSETGGIYLIKRGTMFKDKEIDKKIGHINIDPLGSFDISSDYGWELAKTLVKSIDKI